MIGAMVASDGAPLATELRTWFEPPSPEETRVLARARGPVLDIGCGPGRHAHALSERGVAALGVDVAPAAVALARRRGAIALRRSVFDPLPGTGRWRSALLLDGNIGIGGDPRRLLTRIRDLLRFDGSLFVEVDPPETASTNTLARIEMGASASDWFPWARVGADDLAALAEATRYSLLDLWCERQRWFGCLRVAY